MRVVLTIFLMMFAPYSFAEWVRISETNDNVLYIDPTSIRAEGSLRKVWLVVDKKTPDGTGVLSTRTLQEIDCKGGRNRTASLSTYPEQMAKGTIIVFDSTLQEWSYVPPDSAFDDVLKTVCKTSASSKGKLR